MYGWIWQKLPGNTVVKLVSFLALIAGFVALLWFLIFPWVERFLPFGDVTVS
ncbi:MAG: hypothetical protein ACRDPW_09625 [Mycobacteriales bacterium]